MALLIGRDETPQDETQRQNLGSSFAGQSHESQVRVSCSTSSETQFFL